MKEQKRRVKENNILEAAKNVFSQSGFKNTKMEDISAEAGITKVTLYSYFKSKENLYLAITHQALIALIQAYKVTIEESQSQNGLNSAVSLLNTFMSFNEDNPLYSELLLDYYQLIRTIRSGEEKIQRLSIATLDSSYFDKLQEVHNLPFKLALKEVERGQKDGSIKQDVNPMLATLQAWTLGLGYTKVMSTSGADAIFNIPIHELKENLLNNLRVFLKND